MTRIYRSHLLKEDVLNWLLSVIQSGSLTVTIFKIPYHYSNNQLFPGVESMMSPLLHFSSYKVSSLVRSNVWSILTVDKTLCKSMDSSFCKSVMCITRKSIHSSRDKALPFSQLKWSSGINLLPCFGWSLWRMVSWWVQHQLLWLGDQHSQQL